MFSFLSTCYNYSKVTTNFILFIYIYKYLFDSCNERILIKQKNSNKSKYVTKSKILLSFTYFILLSLIYSSLSIRVLYTSTLISLLGSLLFIDQINLESEYYLTLFDKNKSVRIIWKIFYTIINVLLLILNPIYKQFNKQLVKIFKILNDYKDNPLDILSNIPTNLDFVKNYDLSIFTENIKNNFNQIYLSKLIINNINNENLENESDKENETNKENKEDKKREENKENEERLENENNE